MITAHHIEQAKQECSKLGCYIAILSLHSVVGAMKMPQFEQVRRFLDKHRIEHDFNGDGTIWLPTLSEGLKTIFQINRPI